MHVPACSISMDPACSPATMKQYKPAYRHSDIAKAAYRSMWEDIAKLLMTNARLVEHARDRLELR